MSELGVDVARSLLGFNLDVVLDDPDDNKFIEAGFAGEVDLIVSQDKHLLRLGEYEGIKIVRPEEALGLV